jgi:hypothetical protein
MRCERTTSGADLNHRFAFLGTSGFGDPFENRMPYQKMLS